MNQYKEYKPITVAQLLKQIVELPPMMPIFCKDSQNNDSFFVGLTLDESGESPVLFIRHSINEEKIEPREVHKDEQLDWKREQARQMTYESHKASTPVDQYATDRE